MRPHETIRRAAAILKDGGWTQGEAARDHQGRGIPLFGGTRGDTSRSQINPEAKAFSIAGAIAKAIGEEDCPNRGLLWDTLSRRALAETGVPPGGTNYLHPLIQYNEDMDRTKEQVLAFLESCAVELESVAKGRAA